MIAKLLRYFYKSHPVAYRHAIKLKRTYRLHRYEQNNRKMLEVSGGRRPLSKDYINVDILDAPEVDIITDISKTLPFGDQSVDEIVTVATLEHFNIHDIRSILGEFYRILKPGGTLTIGVPAMHKIFQQYKEHGCTDTLLLYMHGAQKDQYDVHLCILDASRFITELKNLGFQEAREEMYDIDRHDANFMMKLVAVK